MGFIICPACGRRTATEAELAHYDYSAECGLPAVFLRGGVIQTSCERCGETCFGVLKEGQLLQAIAVTLLTSPYHLVGQELRYLRRACRLTQQQLAKILKCRRATVAEREAAGNTKSSDAEQVWVRLVLLHAFGEYLRQWPDHDFLTPEQRKLLRAFESEFARRALGMRRLALGGHRRELKMRADGTWNLAAA